jgi:hypothetical protein
MPWQPAGYRAQLIRRQQGLHGEIRIDHATLVLQQDGAVFRWYCCKSRLSSAMALPAT